MSSSIKVPQDSRITLAAVGGPPIGLPYGVAVFVIPPGMNSVEEAFRGKPAVHAAVTHDKGVSWPDRFGCQLAQAAINGGGLAVLHFTCGADATECRRKLEEGRRP